MNSDEKNNNYLNQLATSLLGTNQLTTFATLAGATALFGGALYYYLNSSTNNSTASKLIDYKNISSK